MKTSTQQLGKKGEDEACRYLLGLGQRIIERNWRSGHLEIDVITLDSEGLHFVEVKSRKAPVMAEPEVNVGFTKQHRIVSAALAYLHSKDAPHCGDLEIFFDVVTVVFFEQSEKIEYYPKAYIPIYV